MPRIHMPPSVVLHAHTPHKDCMIFGHCLEIVFDKTGDLEIDDPNFFTVPFVGGTYPKDTVLGKYYAVADHTKTMFHFTVTETGKEYDVELEVRNDCRETEPCVP